ncbi:major allergen Alt a 1 subunit [Phaeosphaeriaceae sp. PMI808]|nr:major allergen Alt a 1 subunit [Phaeosphaeriaceae sp. PMI808]
MQFTIAAITILAASFTTVTPLDAQPTTAEPICPVVQQGDYVWKVSRFWARKLDGKNINSIDFNIEATNKGTLNFQCGTSADPVEDGKFYQCGENSFIFFAFQASHNGLILKQDVSEDIQYVATTTIPNVCRVGGSGPNDYVCQGVSDAYLTLVQLPIEE